MLIKCAHTDKLDPASLKPNPLNPNKHSAHQIRILAEIIKEQGWRNPITVSNRSGFIVRGHGRLEAALLLGCTEVPVDAQDYDTDAEELADLLADNRLAELADLDEAELQNVIAKIREIDPLFDLILTGFSQEDLDKLNEETIDPLAEIETIPAMECQPFEHHDYLIFIFKNLRDWMQALKVVGAPQRVDYAIEKQKAGKLIGIGRVLDGRRLFTLAGTGAVHDPAHHHEPGQAALDDQPQTQPEGDAGRAGV